MVMLAACALLPGSEPSATSAPETSATTSTAPSEALPPGAGLRPSKRSLASFAKSNPTPECYDRATEPYTPVVDVHFHPRPFGGPAIPPQELFGYFDRLGVRFVNYFGIGRDYLDFVVDRSPHKQGRFMPGVHLPIDSPARLLRDRPDFVLLLTWNFADEILEQQAEFRQRGGRFIIPVPEVRVA